MKNQIGKKLLIRVLQVSTCVTVLFTIISFYLDYQTEQAILSDTKNQIKENFTDNLALSVYNFDTPSIQTQVKTLLNFQEIISAKLTDEKGEVLDRVTATNQEFRFLETWSYSLIPPGMNDQELVGQLEIIVTRKYMYLRMIKKISYFFFSQGLKTLIVSFILLFIFNNMIVSHLLQMSGSLEQFKKNDYKKYDPVKLKLNHQDELAALSIVTNELCEIVQEKLHDAKKEILVQKAQAINSAKLASIGEMAGGIAHEINNPLAVIDGNINIIRRQLEKMEGSAKIDIENRCESMQGMVKRIEAIVKGLRHFSREGDQDLKELVSVHQLVEQALTLCQEKLATNGVSLNTDIDPELQFSCRTIQIGQVILNILYNALDALSETPSPIVVIEAYRSEGFIDLVIKNNGPKIPNHLKEKILEPFYTSKDIGKGTGLGLSISVGIIEGHDGQISVYDSGPWTVFRIRLPAAESVDSESA